MRREPRHLARRREQLCALYFVEIAGNSINAQAGDQMKLSCPQESLAKGLSVVRPAVAARTTLPITQNVLVATDSGRLKLSATDLEIALSCWLSASIEEDGTTTVPA